jgi:signal transduction histidine kinase
MSPLDPRSAPDPRELRYLEVIQETPDPILVFSGSPGDGDARLDPLHLNPPGHSLLEEFKEGPAKGGLGPGRLPPSLANPLRRLHAAILDSNGSGVPREERIEVRNSSGTLRRLRLRGRRVGAFVIFRIVDETETLEAEREMRRRTELLEAAAHAAAILLSGPWRDGFDTVARVLGEAAGVSRVYHFVRVPDPPESRVVRQTHEWCAPGIRPEIDNPALQHLDLDQMGAGPILPFLERGVPWTTQVEAVEDPALRGLLESQDIRAVACFPYRVDGQWRGYIGMDDCLEARRWTEGEVEALQTAAILLGAAMEREAEQAHLREGQRLDSVGRLAGGMAHDFNNLLTVVRANLELVLLEEEGLDPEVEEGIQAALDATGRGARLIQQLLAFARRQMVQPVPVEMNGLVEGFSGLLHRLLRDRIEVTVTPSRNPLVVHIDPGQLEQVLMNLALNARDAMPSGGTLALTTRNEEGWAILEVHDNGEGIPSAIMGNLFEPFFTTKPPGQGVGLGLSTVYGIVKQAGGEIRVESEMGRGSRFEVRLPLSTRS